MYGTPLLILILLAYLQPLAFSESERGYRWFYTVKVLVPAVSYVNGVYRGVVSELVVSVAWPGSGTVYFAADPLTEVDTQASARMAALVASMLAGVDYHSFDYFIHLKAPAPIVGGPSASGAMAVALLAALRGVNISGGFSMTGMVEPDAVLGPVGGIPEKLEAVAEAGVKRFVIPLGQEYARDLNTNEMVDVVALGRRLGVNVTPAPTILDAYVAATGDKGLLEEAITTPIPGYPYKLIRILKEIAGKLLMAARSNLTCWKEISKSIPTEYAEALQRYYLDANNTAKAAAESLKGHFYYSAASFAFRAAIDATYLCLAGKTLASKNPAKTAASLAQRYLSLSSKLLVEANETLVRALKAKPTDVLLQLAITAASRIEDAVETLRYVNESLSQLAAGQNIADTLYASVYLYYRSLTALQWANTTLTLAGTGLPVSWGKLREALTTYLYFAKTEAEYLQALGVDIGNTYRDIDTAYQLLERNTTYSLIRATSISLNTISTLTLLLHKVFSVDVRDSISAAERSLTILLRLAVARYNVTPIMPLLYYEYSTTVTGLDTKLALLVEASGYATLLQALAAKPAKPPLAPQQPSKTITRTVTVTVERRVTQTVTTTATKTATTSVTVTKTRVETVVSKTTLTTTSTLERTVTTTKVKEKLNTSILALSTIIALAAGLALGLSIGRRGS